MLIIYMLFVILLEAWQYACNLVTLVLEVTYGFDVF